MSLNWPKSLYGVTVVILLSSLLSSRALLEGKTVDNPIWGAWASIYGVCVAVVIATTLLLEREARVHD